MSILSSLLLSISTNIAILSLALPYKQKELHSFKSNTLFLAILISFGTFISMFLGNLILPLFPSPINNIFGSILLLYLGIYYMIEYVKMKRKQLGYDVSFFYESSFNNIDPLNFLYINNSEETNKLKIKNYLSFYIIFSNIFLANFAASIAGININLTIFITFTICIFFSYIKYFIGNIHIDSCNTNSNLTVGIILFLLGFYQLLI